MVSLRSSRRLFLFLPFLFGVVFFSVPSSLHATTIDQRCTEKFTAEILSLRTAYRTVQYGDLSRSPPWSLTLQEQLLTPLREGILRGGTFREKQSVLGTEATRTSTLVPYLVENLRGLSCRLQQTCNIVEDSLLQGGGTTVLPTRPLGCSRLNLLRNRFYVTHPLRGYEAQFSECIPVPGEAGNPQKSGVTMEPEISSLVSECRKLSERVIDEEEATLKSVVAYDVAARGLRQIFLPLKSLLSASVEQLATPVRKLVESFSVLHAIPCLQPHCD